MIYGVMRLKFFYKSTRGNDEKLTSAEAIIKGIAEDGGLFVPSSFSKIEFDFDKLKNLSYNEIALTIIKMFLPDYTEEEIRKCIKSAYDEKFDTDRIAPTVKKGDAFFLELYHGPTLAFKDMALSILPYLLKTALKKTNNNKEVVILAATSGDTGKAALEGFADVENTKIVVFYPKKGVSVVQERQMVTQKGSNTFVVGIDGNFDDAQNGVKNIFSDKIFNQELDKNNYILSSANSINIGRLIPQIVYYFYSYLELLRNGEIEKGEKINVAVPTGNFGNILAAFYAKKVGLPINKFICASNKNNVLTDFIKTGVYDRRRNFYITESPSMDILISSNLERLIYELSEQDGNKVESLMMQLKNKGFYEVDQDMKNGLLDFYGGFADDVETKQCIKNVYENNKYVMDTHTAVAYKVYLNYSEETGDSTKTIVVSTASPFKFTRSINDALKFTSAYKDDFQLVEAFSEYYNNPIPNGIKDLDKKEIIHTTICEKENMKDMIQNFL